VDVGGSVSVTYASAEQVSIGFVAQTLTCAAAPAYSWTPGTGAGQVDLHWETPSPVTLAPGSSVTYTLSALTDSLGRPVAFVHVVASLIQVTRRQAGDYLTVGNPTGAGGGMYARVWAALAGGGALGFTVYDFDVQVSAGSDGRPVVAGSSDQLVVVNSGVNAITFNVAILGRSV